MAGQSVFLSDADYDLEAELNASSRWPAQVLYKKRLDPNLHLRLSGGRDVPLFSHTQTMKKLF